MLFMISDGHDNDHCDDDDDDNDTLLISNCLRKCTFTKFSRHYVLVNGNRFCPNVLPFFTIVNLTRQLSFVGCHVCCLFECLVINHIMHFLLAPAINLKGDVSIKVGNWKVDNL